MPSHYAHYFWLVDLGLLETAIILYTIPRSSFYRKKL